MKASLRYEIKIDGIVQGVGFRPFIYNLAKSLSLCGWVNNYGSSVIIDIEGQTNTLEIFLHSIKKEAPPLSHIKNIDIKELELAGYTEFTIKESEKSEGKKVYISPDVSICEDCKRELMDKTDRRYLYPFINCTNCGPRFTIVKELPYDRKNTTMNKFTMCRKCASEYENPADRRYHAQPVSCHHCGPELMLIDNKGCKVCYEAGSLHGRPEMASSPIIKHVQRLILEGRIFAVKGLGGYHLVCDAHNSTALKELRRRKARDDKPFAVMVRDYDSALRYCYVNNEEKKLLESEKKPIVLLKKREDFCLSDEIAPGNPYLGVMLPYTPVHLLLFYRQTTENPEPVPEVLIMTSGNRSSEPIYYKDEEAFDNLSEIADFFLLNDRDIYIRTDDSVTRVFKSNEYIVRRSRGYTPLPVEFEAVNRICSSTVPSVLACGGELKNTFCLNRDHEFYLSHHIGDLENTETLDSFEQGIEHFRKMFNIKYNALAYDLHPEYLSTKYALSLDVNRKIAVQHHHAHIASCMAENNLYGDVIGVSFDGTGYGEDGNIWGGEFFSGDYKEFNREGHLEYLKMPGGEKAIKEPWRMAVSYLYKLGKNPENILSLNMRMPEGFRFLNDIQPYQVTAIIQMMDRNINSPLTSSMGRLFDAVSALTGIRGKINYEGQAAIELEYAAQKGYLGSYGFEIKDKNGIFKISVDEVIRGILGDMENNTVTSIISAKFHETVADIILAGCTLVRNKTGLNRVVLSGGVFQNLTLLEKCAYKLEQSAFEMFVHRRIPSNDGGISLGQAAIAVAKLSTD